MDPIEIKPKKSNLVFETESKPLSPRPPTISNQPLSILCKTKQSKREEDSPPLIHRIFTIPINSEAKDLDIFKKQKKTAPNNKRRGPISKSKTPIKTFMLVKNIQ